MGARWLADQTPADFFATRCQLLHHFDRALGCRAFLIAGDQEAQWAAGPRVVAQETLTSSDHCRQTTLHIRRTTPIEETVADFWCKWRGLPLIERARRHDVRVTGKDKQGFLIAKTRPEIIHRAEPQPFYPKAQCLQTCDECFLATGIIRSDRGPTNEVKSKNERGIHQPIMEFSGGYKRQQANHGPGNQGCRDLPGRMLTIFLQFPLRCTSECSIQHRENPVWRTWLSCWLPPAS